MGLAVMHVLRIESESKLAEETNVTADCTRSGPLEIPGRPGARKGANEMDFRAIAVLSRAVSTMMEEMKWDSYGPQPLHSPIITTDEDYRNLDILLDMMGTLTRMMDTRINFVTTEGKVIREWIYTVLEIGERYNRELEIIANIEQRPKSKA